MALIRHGNRLSALCPKGHPLVHVSGLDRVLRYDGMSSLSSLSRAIHRIRPDFVIPCDDGVVAQLHALHGAEPTLRDLIENSLGDPLAFATVRNRYRLLKVATELGILVPDTRKAESVDDVIAWHRAVAPDAVLKIDGECGGNGVRVCTSLTESLAAWKELTSPRRAATAWKRLIVNRDPLALWSHRNRGPAEVTIQRVIRGRPANIMIACRRGELLASVSVAVLATDGPTGAATVIQRIPSAPMENAASLLASRLRLTGFYGLDFVIDSISGDPHLIEMNPRCTQLGHLQFEDAPCLAEVFSANLQGAPLDGKGKPLPLDIIALFPQALGVLAQQSQRGRESYLDVPWEEPGLAAELRKEPWPDRQWPSRLYHALKPVGRSESVEYGAYIQSSGPISATIQSAAATGGDASSPSGNP
jgi:ATP-grasp domain